MNFGLFSESCARNLLALLRSERLLIVAIYISRHAEGSTPTDILAYVGWAQSALSRVLLDLYRLGIVTREKRDTGDKRLTFYFLNPRYKDLINAVVSAAGV